jgi:hypothetical protein
MASNDKGAARLLGQAPGEPTKIDNDNKSQDEGMKCQVCGHLSVQLEEYEKHKETHPLDHDDLATKGVDTGPDEEGDA